MVASSARTITTRRQATADFLARPSPRVIGTAGGLFALARIGRGRPDRADLAVVAVAAATEPFLEWFLHGRVLHPAPGSMLDRAGTGRFHAGHHRHPDTIDTIVLQGPEAAGAVAVAAAFAAALGWPAARLVRGDATRGALTAMGAATVLLANYEWLHYLFHTSVRPGSARLRRRRADHLRHHHLDDRRWLGITSGLGDRLFATASRDPHAARARSGT